MNQPAFFPMEPETGRFPLLGSESYLYQVKWDGIRMVASKSGGGEISLQGRSLKDKTKKYPEVVEALKEAVQGKDWIVDGELVILKNNKPSFYHIMQREKISSSLKISRAARENPVHYMVFDLIRADGKMLDRFPLRHRLDLMLEKVHKEEVVVTVDSYREGNILFQVTKEQGLEGVVAKQLESPYVYGPHKSSYWKKIKHWRILPLLLGGLLYREKVLSSLLVGAFDREGQLQFLGRVGSGLAQKDSVIINKEKLGLKRAVSPFAEKIQIPKSFQVTWLEPVLVVRIRFLEWTETAKLRAPSFQGFAKRSSPASITLENLPV